MDDHKLEEGTTRVIIQRTPREEMCDELRDEAADLVGAIDSLECGIDELELGETH